MNKISLLKNIDWSMISSIIALIEGSSFIILLLLGAIGIFSFNEFIIIILVGLFVFILFLTLMIFFDTPKPFKK